MKKLAIVILACLTLSGCGNRAIIDTNWTFKYADIQGVGTVEITSWSDYDNSDMIQVKSKDGTVYLTHSVNVILRTK